MMVGEREPNASGALVMPSARVPKRSCNMPTVDFGDLGSIPALAAVLAHAATPVRIRGLNWPRRTLNETIAVHGDTMLAISTGVALGRNGPRGALDVANIPMSVREYTRIMRRGGLPSDSHVFFGIKGTPLVNALGIRELGTLFDLTLEIRHPFARRMMDFSLELNGQPVALALHSCVGEQRISLGGAGAGVSAHAHGPAFALLLDGRKRWFIQKPGGPRAGDATAAHVLPLSREEPTAAWYRAARARAPVDGRSWRARQWQCTQRAGEVVYVPEQ